MENNSNNQEKRKSERLDATFTFTFRVEKPVDLRFQVGWDSELGAVMANLSDLGLSMITKHDLPVGAQIIAKFNIIDFHLQGEERWRRMEVAGKVVSSILLAGQGHKIGVCFERISEEDKLLIANFVKRNKIPSG